VLIEKKAGKTCRRERIEISHFPGRKKNYLVGFSLS
jgi:hypothetical protein